MHATGRIGRLREQRQSILADHFHFRARDRHAGGNGLHEYVLRAIQRAFHENSQIGDQQEPEIFALRRIDLIVALAVVALDLIGIDGFFFIALCHFAIELRVVTLHTQQEDAAFVGAIFLQVITEIQCLVMRLALFQAW